LHNSGIENTILMGFKTKNDIVEYDEYTKYGNVLLTTEDGSAGEKGYVTNHSIFTKVSNFDQIFACGPINMLKAIAKIAKKYNVQCQVSLENTMACGIGVCLCCVTKTVRGNICTCTEGPVFNINELLW
jgi:dihydroorotate dehydrogenase electron transfer subunit